MTLVIGRAKYTDAMNRCDALRRVVFLKYLPDAARDVLAQAGEERRLAKGEVLFAENARCIGLIVVLSGAVKVCKLDNRGRELTLGVEGPGASVAEIALFDGGNYPYSAEAAQGDTHVLIIPRARFHDVLRAFPELAEHALRALAIRLRRLISIAEAQTLHTVRARLAAYLLQSAAGRASFRLAETNEAIGSHIGTVREVVSRTLRALKDVGAISINGRWITMEDEETLRRIAGAADA